MDASIGPTLGEEAALAILGTEREDMDVLLRRGWERAAMHVLQVRQCVASGQQTLSAQPTELLPGQIFKQSPLGSC